MKLWKGVTFAFMLCGAALSIFLTRNMPTARRPQPRMEDSSSSSSSSLKSPPSMPMPPSSSQSTLSSWSSSSLLSPSSSSPPPSSTSSSSFSSKTGGPHRTARDTGSIGSLLSEYSRLLQSFTDGELQQVIGTLVDRGAQRDSLEDSREQGQEESQTRRTRRAKRRPQPCSLHELEVTVSQLGLGYDSDETLLFRYCSGRCAARRRNYDITLEHVRRAGLVKRGRKDQVTAHTPCCRPITYEEDISFLDNNSRYHTIQEVSAQECGCV